MLFCQRLIAPGLCILLAWLPLSASQSARKESRSQASQSSARVVFSNHTYQYLANAEIAWEAARSGAASMVLNGCGRGHLVTITSKSENDFVTEIINQTAIRRVWLGLYQPDPMSPPAEGWEWVSGEPFEYENWAANEPNDEGILADFGAMWGPAGIAPLGTWGDKSGSELMDGYLVEWDCEEIVQVFEFPTAVTGAGNSTEITLVQSATMLPETSASVDFRSPLGADLDRRGALLIPNSTASVDFEGGDTLEVGHVAVQVGPGVAATEIIRLSSLDGESSSLIGVGPSPSCEKPVVALKRNPEFTTAVALSNTSQETVTCGWTIYSGTEGTLRREGTTILPPLGQIQLFPLDVVPAFSPFLFEGNIQYECDIPLHAFSLFQRQDGALVSNAAGCLDRQDVDESTSRTGQAATGLSLDERSSIPQKVRETALLTIDPALFGEVATLNVSDGARNDEFGDSVGVSEDTVIVGSPSDDDAGSNSGSAYIFDRNQGGDGNWGQIVKLTLSDEGDGFGAAVAISGGTIVVGARLDDDGGSNSGSVYIFESNGGGTDNWGQVKKLAASDAEAGDRFGISVAINGDTLVVGAGFEDHAGSNSGSAYVFDRNQGGADNWGQVKKLIASDGAAEDRFGESVAISGDYVVIGARLDDSIGNASGSAYLFERNREGTNSWGQIAKLTASDAATDDLFGASVAISDDTVVVGAFGDDDAGASSGSAYLFDRNQGGADSWGQITKLSAVDADGNDFFGISVAISDDTVLVGALFAADAAGSVYRFERNHGGVNSWGQFQKFTASGGKAGDRFGSSAALHGDAVVVGSPFDDDKGPLSGSANVFVEVTLFTWILQGTAQGGAVSATINGCSIGITTVAGQSASIVAANFVASANSNECSESEGITGEAVGSELTIAGPAVRVSEITTTDPGLQYFIPTTVDFPTAVAGAGNSTEITFVQGANAPLETPVSAFFRSLLGEIKETRTVLLTPNSTASVRFVGDDAIEVGHIELGVGPGVIATEVIRLSTSGDGDISLIGVGPSPSCKRPVVALKRNLELNTGVALSNTRHKTVNCDWSIHSGSESTLVLRGRTAVPPLRQIQSFPLGAVPNLPPAEPFEGNIQYDCELPLHAFSLFQRADGALVSNTSGCFDEQSER